MHAVHICTVAFSPTDSAALFHNPNQDVRMAVHGDDFVCLSDDSLLTSKYTAKDTGTLGFEDSHGKSLLLLNRVFRVGVDQTGQYLDIELDLRHAPLIISESGCNTNTKAVSTPREKLQDKLVDHCWKSSSRPVNSFGRPRPFTSMRLGVSFLTWAVARLLIARTASASPDAAAT